MACGNNKLCWRRRTRQLHRRRCLEHAPWFLSYRRWAHVGVGLGHSACYSSYRLLSGHFPTYLAFKRKQPTLLQFFLELLLKIFTSSILDRKKNHPGNNITTSARNTGCQNSSYKAPNEHSQCKMAELCSATLHFVSINDVDDESHLV